jgi:hypothetical protein
MNSIKFITLRIILVVTAFVIATTFVFSKGQTPPVSGHGVKVVKQLT